MRPAQAQYLDHWYAQFHDHLLRLALRWGHGMEESRDLVQQFFLELLQKHPDPDTILNPQAYLTRSFSRKMIDDYRKARQQQRRMLPPHEAAYEPSVLENIVRLQANEELMHHLRAAYGALPARCRKMIYLKYFEGLTTEQIAERTGLNTRTVYNNLYEGIKALRQALQSTYPRMKLAAMFSLLPLL